MPEIPDVIPGEAVESDWGNQIRNRTVQRYADAAERDTLVPLPVAGDLAYLDDSGTVTLFDGTEWKSGTAPGVYVLKAGDSMQGELNMSGNAIFGLPAPNNDGDATSKGYVDGLAIPVAVELIADATSTVWYTTASGIVSVGIQTTIAQGSTIANLPVEVRPGFDSDVNWAMNMYNSGGTAQAGTAQLRVRGVNGALFLAGVPSGYTPGSDLLRATATYVIGVRGF